MMDKVYIWFLFFTLYFNLVSNFLIVSIWFLIFQCYVNLVTSIIFWLEIADMSNAQNKKLVSIDVAIK